MHQTDWKKITSCSVRKIHIDSDKPWACQYTHYYSMYSRTFLCSLHLCSARSLALFFCVSHVMVCENMLCICTVCHWNAFAKIQRFTNNTHIHTHTNIRTYIHIYVWCSFVHITNFENLGFRKNCFSIITKFMTSALGIEQIGQTKIHWQKQRFFFFFRTSASNVPLSL